MALTSVAMTCGNGLRVTDSGGGCISWGYTVVGDDSRFQGPQFTLMFRFKLASSPGPDLVAAIVGITDASNVAKQFSLSVINAAPDWLIGATVSTTLGGTVTPVEYLPVADSSEHSVAWTYDVTNSVTRLYYDGVEVDSAATPIADLGTDGAATDRFVIKGSDTPGLECFYIDRVMFSNEIVSADSIAEIHASCDAF
jgi:hypothetical protein